MVMLADSKKLPAWVLNRNAQKLATLSNKFDARGRLTRFVNAAIGAGFPVLVIQAMRTSAEQAALYAIGRTVSIGSPIVTKAKPGSSLHETGRAIDLAFIEDDYGITYDGPWDELGVFAVDQAGVDWSGNWRNAYEKAHFEVTGPAGGKPAAPAPVQFEPIPTDLPNMVKPTGGNDLQTGGADHGAILVVAALWVLYKIYRVVVG